MLPALERAWARFWRRWVIRRWGRWRDRWARCKVCGRRYPSFKWQHQPPGFMADIVPGRFMCPRCRSRYSNLGLTLGRMRILEKERRTVL